MRGRRESSARFTPRAGLVGLWLAAGALAIGRVACASAAEESKPDPPGWRAVSAQVDEHLAARWDELGIEPAEPASDSDFLRRAHLDLIGVVPTAWEARAFLSD